MTTTTNNFINISNKPGIINVFDADTQELLFVTAAENIEVRCKAIDDQHKNNNIKHYTAGWSEGRVTVAKQARMLLFVGNHMPEYKAQSLARQLDKFSKSKPIPVLAI
tara:strand:+ start:990 stop:1313 length:324 start_codon:yes stop_codon:yes gene_type:complete